MSDAAFGDVKAQIHKDYNNIKVGDILRVDHDTHSVIVLEVREDSVIVAEGNFNSSIHWGREILTPVTCIGRSAATSDSTTVPSSASASIIVFSFGGNALDKR